MKRNRPRMYFFSAFANIGTDVCGITSMRFYHGHLRSTPYDTINAVTETVRNKLKEEDGLELDLNNFTIISINPL